MKIQLCRIRRKGSQSGTVLPLIAGVILALMALFGFAVDIANLHRAKIRIQNAVNSAVGVTYLLEDIPPKEVRRLAEQSVLDNLAGKNFISPIKTPIVKLEPPGPKPRSITVSASASIPLYVLDMVPGFPSQSIVSARAQTGNVKLAVAFVLDTSNSMNSHWDEDCTADDPCPKFPIAKEGVKNFLSNFSAADRFALISFGGGSRPMWSMR